MNFSDYAPAVFGIVGSLVGGTIAATVSLVVARQTRMAAEQSWVRDSRRETYDRFLTRAQELLVACIACRSSHPHPDAVAIVDRSHSAFFEAYTVVQTVAERAVVDAARVHAYRLLELKKQTRDDKGFLGTQTFDHIASLVRLARHDTIDAMRRDLGLAESARPPELFNPFEGTALEQQYRRNS